MSSAIQVKYQKLTIHSKPNRNQSKLSVCTGGFRKILAYEFFEVIYYIEHYINAWIWGFQSHWTFMGVFWRIRVHFSSSRPVISGLSQSSHLLSKGFLEKNIHVIVYHCQNFYNVWLFLYLCAKTRGILLRGESLYSAPCLAHLNCT